MHPQVQAAINNLAKLEEETPVTQYPTVTMQYEEMKRVALKDLKNPSNPEEIEDMMRFAYFMGYAHALTQQIVLHTQPGPVADRVSTAQAAEAITEVKRFHTYYGQPKREGA